ncbi:ABC transporter ATP-binding protein [Mesorhizobium sp. ESP-6-4]|uniref:ABC transporter ATP-binding protein n=1 Tax=Mesorhizobium sp. ESP-6-4 TaxID=2876624 RepID=UPI001CCB9534|nr:ABC transporter ATP-binding protein [Mesorhizobium sp. ESP-6-4]MBZ9660960.1 ABC transporter ATP-binding protein [Mesorhizobium sp. ESP-6-4]
MSSLVELSNVGRDFDGGRIVAVDDVSLAIGNDETVAIVGRSGSGKSTILNLVCGLDRPTRGEVRFEGRAVNGSAAWAAVRASRIGIVFQNFCLLPSLSARENIEVALLGNLGGARQRRARALELLAHFGLADRATLQPAELSGGERQRLAIARALANRPKLLLADEPTGSLDVQTSQSVMDIIGNAQREFGTAVIVVTHDEDVAALCGRRVEISDGRIRLDSRAAAISAPAPASRIG